MSDSNVEYEGRYDDMDWDEKKSYGRWQDLEGRRLALWQTKAETERTKASAELAEVSPGEEMARLDGEQKKEIEFRRIEMMEKTMGWRTFEKVSFWAGVVTLGCYAIQAFAG